MKKGRRKNDFYPTTSAWITEQLLKHVPQIGGAVLEPCSGNNDMVKVLNAHPNVASVVTNDIDFNRLADFNFDARGPEVYKVKEFDWIVTNPPFSVSMEILQQAYEHSHKGCAFLLRLSFLEPTLDRADWLVAHPPTYQLTMPRYSFTGDGSTDSVTCAWLVWEKGNSKQTNLIIPRAKKEVTT